MNDVNEILFLPKFSLKQLQYGILPKRQLHLRFPYQHQFINAITWWFP